MTRTLKWQADCEGAIEVDADSRCRDGTFSLAEENPQGCTIVVSARRPAVNLFRCIQITMQVIDASCPKRIPMVVTATITTSSLFTLITVLIPFSFLLHFPTIIITAAISTSIGRKGKT